MPDEHATHDLAEELRGLAAAYGPTVLLDGVETAWADAIAALGGEAAETAHACRTGHLPDRLCYV